MLAYQLKARFDAGLVLTGQNDEGELIFIGTQKEWRLAEKLEDFYETYIQKEYDYEEWIK